MPEFSIHWYVNQSWNHKQIDWKALTACENIASDTPSSLIANIWFDFRNKKKNKEKLKENQFWIMKISVSLVIIITNMIWIDLNNRMFIVYCC